MWPIYFHRVMTHTVWFVGKFYIVEGKKYCTDGNVTMNVLTWLVCCSIQITINIFGHFLSLCHSVNREIFMSPSVTANEGREHKSVTWKLVAIIWTVRSCNELVAGYLVYNKKMIELFGMSFGGKCYWGFQAYLCIKHALTGTIRRGFVTLNLTLIKWKHFSID
jgi:hypothetical protein